MIPQMTDPLSKYWDQPRDIHEAPMDDDIVLLTPAQFSKLATYDTSTPSGVYPGKCWKAQEYKQRKPTGVYYLRWYGPESKGECPILHRRIEVVH